MSAEGSKVRRCRSRSSSAPSGLRWLLAACLARRIACLRAGRWFACLCRWLFAAPSAAHRVGRAPGELDAWIALRQSDGPSSRRMSCATRDGRGSPCASYRRRPQARDAVALSRARDAARQGRLDFGNRRGHRASRDATAAARADRAGRLRFRAPSLVRAAWRNRLRDEQGRAASRGRCRLPGTSRPGAWSMRCAPRSMPASGPLCPVRRARSRPPSLPASAAASRRR